MTIERINERELLSAATQGSQIAYRELIHLHQGAVYRFAWAMIGDEHAQQITENAFITAWRQLDYLKSFNMSFRERLMQLVCLDCAELSKRQRRHRINLPSAQDEDALNFPVPPLRYDPRTNMEHLALQTDIEDALRALPLHFRQILLLHEMADLADTQIADIIASDAQTVHADLAVARGFMRRQIILGGGFFPLSDAGTEKGAGETKLRACNTYLSTLAAAADDLCTNAEKQILSAHMAQCPGCQAYYESLCAIRHGIAVMKREVPGDMASYIIHRIQQEDGKGDFIAPNEKPQRHHFRPAFGRFTIIGLCFALILLAYSNGILDHFRPTDGGTPQQPSQSMQNTPASPENRDDSSTKKDLAPSQNETGTEITPPETPDQPEQPDDGAEGDVPAENAPSIIPGGGASSTLIPEGETYAAIYTADPACEDLLSQYCAFSFRATLTDGTDVLYYVVPSANSDALNSALTENALSVSAYTDESAIDPSADKLLYIVYPS